MYKVLLLANDSCCYCASIAFPPGVVCNPYAPAVAGLYYGKELTSIGE